MTLFYSFMLYLPRFVNQGIFTSIFWSWFFSISAFYQTILISFEWKILSNPWLMDYLAPHAKKQYKTIQELAKACVTQITSLIHSIICSLGAVWLVTSKSAITTDHLFGVTFLSQIHGIHSSALFFTELIDLLQKPLKESTTYDLVILFHHTAASIAFGMCALGVGTYYSSMILLSEISNPWLAARWFLLQFNQGSTKTYKIVENGFVVLFFFVRVFLAYFWMTPTIMSDLLPLAMGDTNHLDVSKFPLYTGQLSVGYSVVLARLVVLFLFIFHSMNAFFMYKIVAMATRSPKTVSQPEPASIRDTKRFIRRRAVSIY